MADIGPLNQYISIGVVITCYVIGWVIKNYFPIIESKYIPLIMLICGIIVNVSFSIIEGDGLTLSTIVTGAISGLSSSGTYELFKKTMGLNINLKNNSDKNEPEEKDEEDEDD